MQGSIIVNVPVPEFLSTIESIVRKVLSEKQIDNDQLITSDQVMKLCSISHVTLQKWRNKGKIPFIKVDNKILYSKAEVLKALPSQIRNNNVLKLAMQ